MQRWVERPEARWALWAGVLGALVVGVLGTRMILRYGAEGAALGFVLLPLVAATAAVPVGIWGAALGHVVLHLRGRSSEPKMLFWVALAASLSLPAVVGSEIWRGRALEAAVQEVRGMNGVELERAFHESPFAHDKYFLGALVQHPGASPALLDRIARLEDPALSQRMWSPWDVMGENRTGASVKDLVERHPNRRN